MDFSALTVFQALFDGEAALPDMVMEPRTRPESLVADHVSTQSSKVSTVDDKLRG